MTPIFIYFHRTASSTTGGWSRWNILMCFYISFLALWSHFLVDIILFLQVSLFSFLCTMFVSPIKTICRKYCNYYDYSNTNPIASICAHVKINRLSHQYRFYGIISVPLLLLLFAFQSMFISIWVSHLEIVEFRIASVGLFQGRDA